MSQERPFVSVIMPVRNEGSFIERSLGAVVSQDYPTDRFEVLVVDGESTDDTVALITRLASGTSIPVRILPNPKRIAPAALNLGIAEAKGEIVVRVDGHCVVPGDFVSRNVRALGDSDVGCVGGPIVTLGEGWVSRAIATAMSSSFGVGNSTFRTMSDDSLPEAGDPTAEEEQIEVDTVPFPAFRRAVLETAGPFDEELVRNQDDEYSFRLRKLGYRVLLLPTLQSRYFGRASIRKMVRQYYQYGVYKVRVLQRHPRQMKLRHFVPPAFAATIVAASLSAFVSFWPLAALALLYGSANLAASLHTAASRRDWLALPLLPLLFAGLHLSYGFGFLWGLVRFAGGWFRSPISTTPEARHAR